MDVFTTSLFGHREIDDLRALDEKLATVIKNLLNSECFISFIIGRHGEFDKYAASVIKRARKESGCENSEIILVLPYSCAKAEYYEKYYDGILIPETLHRAHPKVAITLKNKWMVEESDLVIVYVKNKNGGAYTAMKYAEKLGKKIINLYEA